MNIEDTINKPLVSIIIPTYMRPENLKRAINSCLCQTYTSIELIIVDDNNPSSSFRCETESIMKEYQFDEKIKYIKHEKNMNGAAARNTGIKYANGKYIAFLDDDDEYLPDKIEKQVDIIEKLKSDCGGVYSGFIIKEKGKILIEYQNVLSGNFQYDLLSLNYKNFFIGTGSNLFFKKSILEELKGFNERFYRHQDWEFLIRFFRKYKLYGIKEVMLVKHQDSKRKIDPYAFKDNKCLYLDFFEIDISIYSKKQQKIIYRNHFFEIAFTFLQSRKYKEALIFLLKTNNYKFVSLKQLVSFIYQCIKSVSCFDKPNINVSRVTSES